MSRPQCTRVPPSVERVLSELKLEYSKKVEDWHKVVDTWDEDWTRQREEAWAQLETPAERAAHDLDRFMEHYFLTDGQPDPAKKPEPLALYGLVDSQVIANLCQRTALVPGLNIVQAGSADDPTICIGWEHASLHGLILEIANSSLEKQKRKAQKMWNKAMETHRQLVETNSKSAPEVQHGESKEQLALSMACGSFVVRCKAIADLCADKPLSTNLSINITDTIANNNEILRAAVDFGIFRGTAVLSCSQDVLNWFVRFYEKTAKPSTTTTKDGLESSSSPAAKKRRLDNAAEGEHPVKQQKHDGPLPRGRIILQMRGLDTTNYKMCEDIQHGHLDFIDSSWSKFTGMVQVPGVLQPVEFEGFRVANKADVEPPPWKSFFPGAATPGTIGDVVPETSR